MKLLLQCNVMLPKIASILGKAGHQSGGWVTGLSEGLLAQEDLTVTMCFPSHQVYVGKTLEGMAFRSFTAKRQREQLAVLVAELQPDLVHIFGTEFKHTLDLVEVCESAGLLDRVVVSTQGFVTVYARHYTANLPCSEIGRWAPRDFFFKKTNVYSEQQKFKCRGRAEIIALQKVKHVIGRTDFDRAVSLQINPRGNYHFCNETLRSSFYSGQWQLTACEPHSIFVNQCWSPAKGFHFMLEAMPEILRYYPNAHVYTTGPDLLHPKTLKEWFKLTSYRRYLARLIRRYHLEGKVTFLGTLDELAMKERYLRSRVFVSPSSIENSPNSIGEAMILGVPVVASDVGGVKNMLAHNQEGFVYQADAPYMLAYYVKELFADAKRSETFSCQARQRARQTHDRQTNLNNTLKIYQKILGT